METASILDDLRRGDLGGLARAFDRWHQRVRVLARRLLSDAAAAEDVVQEAFAALPRAARHFRGEVDLETFLLAIAVKRARHHRRAAARRQRALARLSGEERGAPRNPEQEAYRRELGLRLAAALDQLPLRQSTCLHRIASEPIRSTSRPKNGTAFRPSSTTSRR